MPTEKRREELEKVMEGYPVALDPDQVAEIIGITRRTVDKLLDDGKLIHFVINPESERKLKRVTKVDLIDYMLKNYI